MLSISEIMNRYLHGRTLLALVVTVFLLVVLLQWKAPDLKLNRQGFVMTMEYTGQLVAGLRALESQQCWISSFGLPLVLVEPFLNNSTLRNSYRLWKEHIGNSEAVQFHDVLDLNYFNQRTQTVGNPVLVSWEHFYTFAPRKVIVVTIDNVHYYQCLQFRDGMCSWDIEQGNFFAPCKIPEETQQTLHSLKRHNFVVVRNVCLNCMEEFSKLTPGAITEHIFGPYNPHDVTVIFNKWKFSLKLLKDCQEATTCMNVQESAIDSQRVIQDSKWYIEMYLPSQKFISVMIRLEWYFITHQKEKGKEGFATKCLTTVLEAVSQFEKRLGRNNKVHRFVTMDVGAYGSASFEGTLKRTNTSVSLYDSVVNHAKKFMKDLYKGTSTYNEWKESFEAIPGIIRDKGYIATVQRSIASRGECLILMGGGHFQHLALQTYLELHPDPEKRCVKFICVAPTFLRMFNSIITS